MRAAENKARRDKHNEAKALEHVVQLPYKKYYYNCPNLRSQLFHPKIFLDDAVLSARLVGEVQHSTYSP